MLPFHTILHPTDLSEHSGPAFRLASGLARDHGARLILLHVSPTTPFRSEAPPASRDALLEKLDELAALAPQVPVEVRLKEGDAVAEILAAAQETDASLIVMGTHGRTGLARLLLGSVAEQIVRLASCPVLTVRAPTPAALPEGKPATEPALA
jgi:nucleotide-binding universal stress UspA family protein